jgi:hypothetical protein
MAGKEEGGDLGVGVAHHPVLVVLERERAAGRLGEHLAEGRVMQRVGVDQRAVEIEEQADPAHARARAGAAVAPA